MPLEHLDDTAKRILKAAGERFLHYGYSKTTMSEIASDCNMSPANLYRYFPSKLDIAEAFVRVLRREQIGRLKEAASEFGLTPPEKLRRVLMTKFRLAYDRWHNNQKAYELSAEILRERPAFAVEWEDAENEILAGVIAEGVMGGCFAAPDPKRLSRIFQDAVFRFTSPAVFHEGEFDVLSAELSEVISLLLDGLSWRATPVPANPGAA